MVGKVSKEVLDRGWRQRRWRWRIGFLGGLMAGFFLTMYTFWGHRTIYMGDELSFNHSGLEKKCGNCHHPFEGVEDSRCAFPCHSGEEPKTSSTIAYWDGIHYVKGLFAYQNCLGCHPPKCHPADEKQMKDLVKSTAGLHVACAPVTRENLILPLPLDENTCESCHHDGCTRSTKCHDCHSEHAGGMPLTMNRSTEVFQGTFDFPEKVREGLLSDYKAKSVEEKHILPLGDVVARGGVKAWRVKTVRSKMPAENCLACHPGVLTRKKPTFEETTKSIVPRSIFSHRVRGHDTRCGRCHMRTWLTERDPGEAIFAMEDCARCHYMDDCSSCHNFHDRADPPGSRCDVPKRVELAREAIALEESNKTTAEESPKSTTETEAE